MGFIMFENAGKKLQVVGYVYFVLGVIASIVIGIVSMKETGIFGLLIIILGIFSSWISVLVIMATAEAAIYSKLAYQRSFLVKKEETTSKTNGKDEKTPEYKTFSKDNIEGGWKCSCGQENSQNDRFCISCGKYR